MGQLREVRVVRSHSRFLQLSITASAALNHAALPDLHVSTVL
jgi:hypothetical protein